MSPFFLGNSFLNLAFSIAEARKRSKKKIKNLDKTRNCFLLCRIKSCFCQKNAANFVGRNESKMFG